MPLQDMELADKRITTLLQDEFPLCEDPYGEIGRRAELGLSAEEVRARVHHLKKGRVIRQISAIFDSRNLGYKSSLVAMKAPADRVDECAKVVSRHPGVSHNYKRDHEFNIWFTIAVPPGQSLQEHVEALHAKAGAIVTRPLPTLKLYKIGVKLNLEDPSVEAATAKEAEGSVWNHLLPEPVRLTEKEIAAVRVLQRDIDTAILHPYEPMAKELGISQQELFEIVRDFQKRALLRRVAAILHHRKAGFRSNGMGVWAVPEDKVDEYGQKMAQFKIVSHCYRRPVYPDWRYNLFTMVHAENDDGCRAIIKQMSQETGLTDYTVLFSTVEYKKTRVEYFAEDDYSWLFDKAA
ncbi:MAG: Lrp/AsnC family transcriptional regulator [Bdellovibrionota bacterium]